MILLLGATSYVGQAYARALRRRKGCFIPLSRETLDYSRFEVLFDYVRKIKPELLINASVYAEPVDDAVADFDRLGMLEANTLLPQTVARVCAMTHTPLGHVSSGSIYTGAKVLIDGEVRIEADLSLPNLHKLFQTDPSVFLGFNESDPPNSSFNSSTCNFASGTKALAEEAIREHPGCYLWRIRLPFSQQDHPDNFLSSLLASPAPADSINSLSHVDDCASACLDLWDRRAPFGTYNVANPGAVTTREVLDLIQKVRKPDYIPAVEEESSPTPPSAASTPHSGCLLDVAKLRASGVTLRPVRDALKEALWKWQPHVPKTTPSIPQLRVVASP